jgi:DNA-binding NarL/FixJ family response regulator
LTNILIFSQPSEPLNQWSRVLAEHYSLEISATLSENLTEDPGYSLIIIHTDQFETNDISLTKLKELQAKILLVGENWPENKQIDALAAGASGYCDLIVPAPLILKAAASVIRGEIWLERHLIPHVIGSLIQSNPIKHDQDYETNKKLVATLSSRELDVAKLIRSGKSNKRIASTLFISERTVKAHLTSIFRKMQVSDRLHLAISLKSFDI